MKNKLRFAGFLISRFKGLIFYAVGIGILIYLTIQVIVIPAREINYEINIFVAFFALILVAVGLFIRRSSKKV
jgi:membrane protein DedA with SNARE-associated domain